jgi:hypothetical protein|eukprot:COSAG01_NODE_21733_length_887_cov_2.214467_1_plen_75_part_00
MLLLLSRWPLAARLTTLTAHRPHRVRPAACDTRTRVSHAEPDLVEERRWALGGKEGGGDVHPHAYNLHVLDDVS